jgi:diguanylate cyclase (GGDEF)-like protein
MPMIETEMRHPQTLTARAAPKQECPGMDNIAPGDWDVMLCAVTARLRTQSASPQAVMLECASALEQLHSALHHERALVHAQLAEIRDGEQRASRMARLDSLTGLSNRQAFHEHIDHALAQPTAQHQGVAVLFLDLDGFKHVNDTHGHAVGDLLLKIVAARLSRAVRAEDVMSRFGGDEFACLLLGPQDLGQLHLLARKLFQTVSAPVLIDQLQLVVRPSIGVAVCPPHATSATAEMLLGQADAAMYRAKRQQCGYVFFDHLDTSP